jgi:hypothetical protein
MPCPLIEENESKLLIFLKKQLTHSLSTDRKSLLRELEQISTLAQFKQRIETLTSEAHNQGMNWNPGFIFSGSRLRRRLIYIRELIEPISLQEMMPNAAEEKTDNRKAALKIEKAKERIEVKIEKPGETEIKKETKRDVEVKIEKASETETKKETKRDAEVKIEKPSETEIKKETKRDVEVKIEKLSETETKKETKRDVEVKIEKPCETETKKETKRDVEVKIEKKAELEIKTGAQKETEIKKEKMEKVETKKIEVVEKNKEPHEVEKKIDWLTKATYYHAQYHQQLSKLLDALQITQKTHATKLFKAPPASLPSHLLHDRELFKKTLRCYYMYIKEVCEKNDSSITPEEIENLKTILPFLAKHINKNDLKGAEHAVFSKIIQYYLQKKITTAVMNEAFEQIRSLNESVFDVLFNELQMIAFVAALKKHFELILIPYFMDVSSTYAALFERIKLMDKKPVAEALLNNEDESVGSETFSSRKDGSVEAETFSKNNDGSVEDDSVEDDSVEAETFSKNKDESTEEKWLSNIFYYLLGMLVSIEQYRYECSIKKNIEVTYSHHLSALLTFITGKLEMDIAEVSHTRTLGLNEPLGTARFIEVFDPRRPEVIRLFPDYLKNHFSMISSFLYTTYFEAFNDSYNPIKIRLHNFSTYFFNLLLGKYDLCLMSKKKNDFDDIKPNKIYITALNGALEYAVLGKDKKTVHRSIITEDQLGITINDSKEGKPLVLNDPLLHGIQKITSNKGHTFDSPFIHLPISLPSPLDDILDQTSFQCCRM